VVPLSYNNWAVGQQPDLFLGDTVYMSTSDYKFYVNPMTAMVNPGVVCQTAVIGLQASQLSVSVLNQTNVFGVPFQQRYVKEKS
jgi:hypothetical protein